MIDSARASMTPEQIESLEEAGEYIHSQVNYETSDILSLPLELQVAIESLKSGLNPSYLSHEEIQLLEKHYGENWKSVLKVSNE